jgi:glycosyltransferase involved in cell wall biosynthesis
MLGGWPEPFGLVAIESMATGTPVIGRRAGGLTETIDHGVTGFLVDDIDEAVLAVSRAGKLSREDIARSTRARFAADRMVDQYESVYRALLAPAALPSTPEVASEAPAAPEALLVTG